MDISYLMLRGIFAAPGITKDQQDFYVDCLKKATETPEWKNTSPIWASREPSYQALIMPNGSESRKPYIKSL